MSDDGTEPEIGAPGAAGDTEATRRVTSAPEEVFAEHRALLFTVAYEMLGSAGDAEDVLQDSWLRWAEVRHEDVRDARAYLVRLVTRQALNRLRTLKRQRESYVGPWLPEPLVTAPDVAEDVELADSVSFAMMVVLETLTPLERAAFVLREVFGFEYGEIAAATGRSEAAVRQLVSRARAHVRARKPRVEPDRHPEEVTAKFLAAAAGGDLQQLMDLLAPDVVLVTDGGGKMKAALRPIHGPQKVAAFLLAVRPDAADLDAEWATVNGSPALLLKVRGVLDSVASVLVAGGRIEEIFFVRNPDKLTRLDVVRVLARR